MIYFWELVRKGPFMNLESGYNSFFAIYLFTYLFKLCIKASWGRGALEKITFGRVAIHDMQFYE